MRLSVLWGNWHNWFSDSSYFQKKSFYESGFRHLPICRKSLTRLTKVSLPRGQQEPSTVMSVLLYVSPWPKSYIDTSSLTSYWQVQVKTLNLAQVKFSISFFHQQTNFHQQLQRNLTSNCWSDKMLVLARQLFRLKIDKSAWVPWFNSSGNPRPFAQKWWGEGWERWGACGKK